MNRVEQLQQMIEQPAPAEVAALRDWLAERDAQAWDHQFEADVRVGKLDALSEAARRAHIEGKGGSLSKPLSLTQNQASDQ